MCRRTSDCASFGFDVVEAEDGIEHLRCFATRKVMHHYAYKYSARHNNSPEWQF